MSDKPLINLIYADAVQAFNGIAEAVYLGRPKTIATSLNSFVSIEFKNEIYDLAAGNSDFSLTTYGYVDLYVKAKPDGTMNINLQTKLAEEIRKKLPYKGKVSVFTRPVVSMMGSDNYGFNVTRVTFNVQTIININNN